MNPRRLLFTFCGILLAVLAVGAGALFVDARGEYNQLKQTEASLRRKLEQKRAQLAENEKILERLKTDPDFVEKIIRQRLNYAKPGETIFVFEN